MITEAEVLTVNNNNPSSIRIPLFEVPNGPKAVFDDICICTQAGSSDAYKSGDKVWVGFINNEMGSPVIIGKIYNSDSKSEASGSSTLSSLSVVGNATLPTTTRIGELTYTDFINFRDAISLLEERVTRLENN